MTGPRDRDAQGDGPPGDDPEEIERRWQEIVAGLGPLGAGPGPDGPPLPGPGPDGRGGRPEAVPPPGPAPGRAGPPVPGPRDHVVEDDDEGEFIPPEPPALGSGDPAVVLSLVGVAGAPAALLLVAILWPGVPGIILGILVAAFVAGAVGLFLSLPRDRDREGPGTDDGAQV